MLYDNTDSAMYDVCVMMSVVPKSAEIKGFAQWQCIPVRFCACTLTVNSILRRYTTLAPESMNTLCALALANDATSTSEYVSLIASLLTIFACALQLVLGVFDLRHRSRSANGKHLCCNVIEDKID